MSFRPAMKSTQPPIQWVSGALSPRVKRLVSESDHLPQTSAEVKKKKTKKKRGSVHPLPYTPSWRSAYLVKYRDNFSFLPYLLI
jgi:hypothetical protein